MRGSPWRVAAQSVLGTLHEKTGVVCQDSHRWEVLPYADSLILVAAVSDGAGSASHSQLGSSLACDLWVSEFKALIETGESVEVVDQPFIESWLARLHREVCVRAESEGVSPRQLAATFLGAAISEEHALFVQVGDGAIVISCSEEPDCHDPVFWPESGEYANMTYFATEEKAAGHLQFASSGQRVEELALFSDGLQSVALDLTQKTAFQPFFTGMFRTVRSSKSGNEKSVEEGLRAFLTSKKLAERTDDDKTLVLATRCLPRDVSKETEAESL